MTSAISDNIAKPISYLRKEDGERRTKFMIDLTRFLSEVEPGKKKDALHVTLRVPLDSRYPEENEIFKSSFELENTGQIAIKDSVVNVATLVLNYELVEMNLENERNDLTEALASNYRTKVIGALLRRDRLKKLTLEQRNSILSPIAYQGASVFSHLFPSNDLQNENVRLTSHNKKDARLIFAAVQSALSRPQLISVKSHEPLFPWVFLYDDPKIDRYDLRTIKPKHFWGYKHEIQQDVGCTSQRTALPQTPRLYTAIDPDVQGGGQHSDAKHPFRTLGTIDEAASVDELGKALKNFKNDLLYFFGHADDELVDTKSWLKLRSLELTVFDLQKLQAPSFTNEPVLAFLNGCRTAPLAAWDQHSILGHLCANSDRRLCCVATVAEVPGAFAAEFARFFWTDFLLNRLPLGTALLRARKRTLRVWANPLGLLYSLFGLADTKIRSVEGDQTYGESNLEFAGSHDQRSTCGGPSESAA